MVKSMKLKHQTFLEQEREILKGALSTKNRIKTFFIVGWLLIFFPVIFRNSPLILKTFLVSVGGVSAVVSTFKNDTEEDDITESLNRSIRKVQTSVNKDRMRQVYDITEIQQDAEFQLNKLKAILELPGVSTEFKIILLEQNGLSDFARALATEQKQLVSSVEVIDRPVLEDLTVKYRLEAQSRVSAGEVLPDGATLIPISDLNNINEYSTIMIPHRQGTGKTGTMCAIMKELDGKKAISTPKPLELPARPIYDLIFGFDRVTGEWAYTGNLEQTALQKANQDLTWYHNQIKEPGDVFAGSVLECVHACYQETLTRQKTHAKNPDPWHILIDEASVLYIMGGVRTDISDPKDAATYERRHRTFIEQRNKAAFMNYRSQKVQMFFVSQTHTLDSLGLQGFGETVQGTWQLHPGKKAISKCLDCKLLRLAQWFREQLESGYAIALLTQEDKEFRVLKMPLLEEVKTYTDSYEDDEETTEDESDASPISENNRVKNGLPRFVAWAEKQPISVTDEEIAHTVKQFFDIQANENFIKLLRSKYIGGVKNDTP